MCCACARSRVPDKAPQSQRRTCTCAAQAGSSVDPLREGGVFRSGMLQEQRICQDGNLDVCGLAMRYGWNLLGYVLDCRLSTAWPVRCGPRWRRQRSVTCWRRQQQQAANLRQPQHRARPLIGPVRAAPLPAEAPRGNGGSRGCLAELQASRACTAGAMLREISRRVFARQCSAVSFTQGSSPESLPCM